MKWELIILNDFGKCVSEDLLDSLIRMFYGRENKPSQKTDYRNRVSERSKRGNVNAKCSDLVYFVIYEMYFVFASAQYVYYM